MTQIADMDETTAALFNRATLETPPIHPQLISGWTRPEVPEGFSALVVLLSPVTLPSGKPGTWWYLDFLDTKGNRFASEAKEDADLGLPWPWVKGFKPKEPDWEQIGIPVLS